MVPEMSPTLKALRALSDPTRLRLLALLETDELSVHELQEVTRLGQSRISTHLRLLEDSGLLRRRREGKRTFYQLSPWARKEAADYVALARQGAAELPESASDRSNLRRVLELRNEQAQVYFNQVAGRFDRSYGPGRSWQAFGQLLLRMLPPVVVADLGSGEGLISELLARRCQRVIAVDNSEKMVAYGARKARRNGIENLEFRLGDLHQPPLAPGEVDVIILSQALHHAERPQQALRNAFHALRPGGQILILDLRAHEFAPARDLYGDHWLGFSEGDLHAWLNAAGFSQVETSVVSREETEPHFETLLAAGLKPG